MKRFATAALVAAFSLSGWAATNTPVWNLYKGGTMVQPRVAYPDQAQCTVAANAQMVAAASTYVCRNISVSTMLDKNVSTRTIVDVSVTLTVLPPPDMTVGVQYDKTKLPAPGIGIGTDNIAELVQMPAPSPDGTGDFRTICAFSHMLADDPIVLPGKPGGSHLHTFFGNTGANANSTVASIATTGNSTCRGGTINRSAYWQPAIIDTKDGTPVKPRIAIIYYKSAAFALPADIASLPQGLRMLAGDPKGSAAVLWGATVFSCNGSAVGSDHDFPPTADKPGPHSIPNCAAGAEIWASVVFPRCWDGINLDSPDHRSHMAYWPIPNPYTDDTHPAGKCPPTHPVTLPEVSITAVYPVTEANAPLRWRLASDMYDSSIPAGYSLHADWFGGWRPEIVDVWTKNCINPGNDCSAHMLGDGRTMNEYVQ